MISITRRAAGAAQNLQSQTCLCAFPLRQQAAKRRRVEAMLGGHPKNISE